MQLLDVLVCNFANKPSFPFLDFLKDGILAELLVKMSRSCRFLLFWAHKYQVTLRCMMKYLPWQDAYIFLNVCLIQTMTFNLHHINIALIFINSTKSLNMEFFRKWVFNYSHSPSTPKSGLFCIDQWLSILSDIIAAFPFHFLKKQRLLNYTPCFSDNREQLFFGCCCRKYWFRNNWCNSCY